MNHIRSEGNYLSNIIANFVHDHQFILRSANMIMLQVLLTD